MKQFPQGVDNRRDLAALARYRVEKLASLCGVTVRRLQRYFTEEEGITPRGWLNEVRQSRGLEQLLLGNSVKATAFELGYQNPCHFSRDFRNFFGVSPSEVLSGLASRVSHSGSSLPMTKPPSCTLMPTRWEENIHGCELKRERIQRRPY